MKRSTRRLCWLVASLWAGQVVGASAQEGEQAPTAGSNAQSPTVSRQMPPLPSSKPPVEFFRELLAMNPGERTKALSNRKPESQKLITDKLQEYEGLTPEQRELRLRATELRYYLRPLMSTPATGREAQLAAVPAEIRPMVEERIRRWDALPPEQRQELLDNELALSQLAELAASSPTQQERVLTNLPPSKRVALEEGLAKWQKLTADQRQAIAERFEQYFSLTAQEKDLTLKTLSEPERRQIQKSLQQFANLPPIQRAKCFKALDRLLQLTPSERQEFLKNAERWQRLTPGEREAWRNLVYTWSRQPPLPTGFRPPKPVMPPLPGSARPTHSMATN